MKTVLVPAIVAISVVASVAVQLKDVDSQYVELQLKILDLLENVQQDRQDAAWWQIGLDYDVEANIDNYRDKAAVEEFLMYYKNGSMPKDKTFSMLNDPMREEAAALFKLLSGAKDIDTFYNTAAFTRVYFNEVEFIYFYYIAKYQRVDTQTLVLPALYETQPELFVNVETLRNAYRVKMQNNIRDAADAASRGIFFENGKYIFYSNSTFPTVDNYLDSPADDVTPEDVKSYLQQLYVLYPFQFELQALRNYLHRISELENLPFQLSLLQRPQSNTSTLALVESIRADQIHFRYQQLLNGYYLNRLSSGLGKIPEFSWSRPIETGYYSDLSTNHAFYSRNQYYEINNSKHVKDVQFLDNYEQAFQSYLKLGNITANIPLIDLRNPQAINSVINYWYTSPDLFDESKDSKRSYETVGLHLLAGTPDPIDKYTVIPSALELYQTSLRDPMFFQFYARILNFILQWKNVHLEPYSSSELNYEGVNINDVQVSKLETFFDIFEFDISNAIFYNDNEFKTNDKTIFTVRQPRLNHKLFSLNVKVNSVAATDAVFKIFLGPKFDNNGRTFTLEESWMYFVELDFFIHKLTPGQNKIERSSKDFALYREDPVSKAELINLLKQGKVPLDMSEQFFYTPERLMLPKGTNSTGGFRLQLYVVAYPHSPLPTELAKYNLPLPDIKPMAYPFDRPARKISFQQSNIYTKDVIIYHEGENNPNIFNFKQYYPGFKN